jgi:hypothetical protein
LETSLLQLVPVAWGELLALAGRLLAHRQVWVSFMFRVVVAADSQILQLVAPVTGKMALRVVVALDLTRPPVLVVLVLHRLETMVGMVRFMVVAVVGVLALPVRRQCQAWPVMVALVLPRQ